MGLEVSWIVPTGTGVARWSTSGLSRQAHANVGSPASPLRCFVLCVLVVRQIGLCRLN